MTSISSKPELYQNFTRTLARTQSNCPSFYTFQKSLEDLWMILGILLTKSIMVFICTHIISMYVELAIIFYQAARRIERQFERNSSLDSDKTSVSLFSYIKYLLKEHGNNPDMAYSDLNISYYVHTIPFLMRSPENMAKTHQSIMSALFIKPFTLFWY